MITPLTYDKRTFALRGLFTKAVVSESKSLVTDNARAQDALRRNDVTQYFFAHLHWRNFNAHLGKDIYNGAASFLSIRVSLCTVYVFTIIGRKKIHMRLPFKIYLFIIILLPVL